MPDNTIVLKKYSNRRLYDTESSTYVTLGHVAEMIREGRQVQVIDQKTSEDVTVLILTQVILEHARQNNHLLPVSLLHLMIRFGEDVLNDFFQKYLEKTIESYLAYQKRMDEQFRLCLELGLDLSRMAERTFSEVPPFRDLFPLMETPPREEGTGTDRL